MKSAKKGQGAGKRGPSRQEPTAEQKERFLNLRARAHRIWLLGQENELLLSAATGIRSAQAIVIEAMRARKERGGTSGRPDNELVAEIVALQEWEKEVIEYRKKHPSDAHQSAFWMLQACQSRLYPERANRNVRAALCLLRFADEMLRREVELASRHEEGPQPGDTEQQILDRLVEDELGLSGLPAVRLAGRHEEFEDADRHAAARRRNAVAQVFEPLKRDFMVGFSNSGAILQPTEETQFNQLVRQTATLASAHPLLDRELPRVNQRRKKARAQE